MITSLILSFARVVLAWYGVSLLVLFLGSPEWAQSLYLSLAPYPFVPQIELKGLESAADVQITLLAYWTFPLLCFVFIQLSLSRAWMSYHIKHMKNEEVHRLDRIGEYSGVSVASYSIGPLSMPTVPIPLKQKIYFFNANFPLPSPRSKKKSIKLPVSDEVALFLKTCTETEVLICSELVQLLAEHPGHYAGAGHGVDLLEHTFNVAAEALKRCNAEFRLPFIAAFAHDIGKLITFKKDANGAWERVGWHSREGARILAALPSFPALPISEQRALILALKHGHRSYQLPTLSGDDQATLLAQRILYSVSAADKSATSAEKDRNLEKLKPQELLWQDFIKNIRTAPVVQRGPRGVSNQLNLPPGNPYVFIYESAWREAAIKRLPEEVAAVLDLNRRNTGKIAKYTQLLLTRLAEEGLLVTEIDGMTTPESNPLWNIRSGMPNKDPDTGSRINGVIVVHAKLFWEKLNYKNSTISDFIVQVECPNADQQGNMSGPREDARNIPQLADKISLNLAPDEINKTSDKASNGLPVMARLDDKKAAEIGLFTSETANDIKVAKRASRRYEDKAEADIPGTYIAPKIQTTPPPAEASQAFSQEKITNDRIPNAADSPAKIEPAAADSSKLVEPIDYLKWAMNLAAGELSATSTPNTAQALPDNLKNVEQANNAHAFSEDAVLAEKGGGIALEPVDRFDAPGEMAANFPDPFISSTFDAQEEFERSLPFEKPPLKKIESAQDPEKSDSPAFAQSSALLASTVKLGGNSAPTSGKIDFEATPVSLKNTPVFLSSGEQSGGIGVADTSTKIRFPHLNVGDKFYTREANLVKQGKKKEGAPYNANPMAAPIKRSFPVEGTSPAISSGKTQPAGMEQLKKVKRKYD